MFQFYAYRIFFLSFLEAVRHKKNKSLSQAWQAVTCYSFQLKSVILRSYFTNSTLGKSMQPSV